ncbi:MAG: hypothetical protein IPH88_08620 [Bacteroidales bacterium]|nr:hypothetical protein [Bacteroidales bacterium]
MKTLLLSIITILLICLTVSGQNTAGFPDPTFNNTGKLVYDKDMFDLYQDVKVQTDGKIVAVGSSMNASYASSIVVSRILENGNFDPDFGVEGHVTYAMDVETMAYKCVIRDNGKILIGGHSTNYAQWGMLVIQLNEDGTFDTSFGNLGTTYLNTGPGENILSALTLQEDGKILIAGYAQNQEYKNVPVVLRLTESGDLDNSFGTDGMASIPVTETDNEFSALGIQTDGKILAAGHISNGFNWFSLLITRFNIDGSIDTTYGSQGLVNMTLNNVDDEFFDLALTPNDDAILTGFSVTPSDYYFHMLLMKFDASGQPVPSFGDAGKVIWGTNPYAFGDDLFLQTDGKIIISGCSGELAPGNNDWALWRYNSDGTSDETFGTNGSTTTDFFENADEALGVALFSDKIIVAGKTRNAENRLDFAVVRYTNDLAYNVTVPETGTRNDLVISPNPAHPGQQIKLSFESISDQNLKLYLTTPASTTFSLKYDSERTSGTTNLYATLPEYLPIGIYCIQLKNDAGLNLIRKIIVL